MRGPLLEGEGAAEGPDEIITTPIPCFPAPLQRKRKKNLKVKLS